MATRMQQRRGTAAQWTAANPVLAAGEIGFETDTNKFKMGNGSSAWTALQYFANAAELAAIIDGAPDLLNTLNELAAAIGDDPAFFTNIGESISDNIDSHNVTTNVHGIANTSLLATTANVATAKGEAETFATTAVTNHNNATTDVHGIDDTAALARTADVTGAIGDAITGHSSDTTDVHGIANTALLATQAYADSAVSTHQSDTTEVHGIANTADLATMNYADTAVSTHSDDTTDVHGITNTADLATKNYADTAVSTHAALTTDVHGIPDTSLLATTGYVDTAVGNSAVDQSLLAGIGIDWNVDTDQFDIDSTVATKTYADTAVSDHNSETENVHGIANTALLATQSYADDSETDAISAAATYTDLLVGDVTVDGTTGNTVAARITAAEDYTDSQIDAHVAVTTNVHGIADTSKIVLKDAASTTLDGALVITGDLTVNGTNFAASATSITIEDNMVQLAHQNAANTVDLGLVVAYNDGAAKHSGIVRDVSDAKWKLFKGVTTEPSTTVDFSEGSLDDLALNNLTAAGVVFTDGTQTKAGVPSLTPIVQKSDSYSLSTLTHRDSLIEVSSTSGTTITIPAESSVNYPVGTTIDILQTNTGQVTIAGAAGVTVNATPGLKLRTRWSSATLMKRAADTWVVYGDLTA